MGGHSGGTDCPQVSHLLAGCCGIHWSSCFPPELGAGTCLLAETIGVGLRMSLGIYGLEISAVYKGDHHSPVFATGIGGTVPIGASEVAGDDCPR